MSINLSAFAGAGAQFFDANGSPLSGGLIYTYLSGTSTPATTYTARGGAAANTNPIVLDAAGRLPTEIWLDGGVLYKFVLKSSTYVQIGSYDGIPSINDPTTATNLITVAGTNALTGLSTPPLTGYGAGAQYTFVVQNNNTGAVTIDIDSLGVKSLTKNGSVALQANDLIAGSIALIEYDGTRFQLLTLYGGNFTTVTASSVVSSSISTDSLTTKYILEPTTISATASTGTINFDVATQSIVSYTTAATANWTLNFRASSTVSLNTMMAVGQTVSVTFMAAQGVTAYYANAFQIDGSAITPKWQNGVAPSAGNSSSTDVYTFAITKTGAATFVVLASLAKFS